MRRHVFDDRLYGRIFVTTAIAPAVAAVIVVLVICGVDVLCCMHT